jgi:hypothetical protein
MDWQMIGALGEAVGAAAVVISLLYVARQVRSATAEAQVHRRHSVIEEFNRFLDLLATDGELSRIYARGVQGGLAHLEMEERVRFIAAIQRMMSALEEGFLMRRAGLWPDWSAHDIYATIAYFAAYPGVREIWRERKGLFSPVFREHMDRLISEEQEALPHWMDPPAKEGLA